MPLSPPAPREHLHTRSIEMRGYRRDDGLWDIEGHLSDVKSYSFHNDWRGEIGPGTPIHDMWIRLTLDDSLTVQDIEVTTDASPFRICPDVAPNFAAVKGATIGPGWNRRIKELLGGRKGCTHLVEMLGAMATVAIQTQMRNREKRLTAEGEAPRRPAFLDTCYALASDSEVTQRLWPSFYTGRQDR
jgi:hypothetical protein